MRDEMKKNLLVLAQGQILFISSHRAKPVAAHGGAVTSQF